jgi:sugar-specific transcriptional regulator TrmB
MDGAELISQLSRLGLTSYEARAYAALVRRDSFSAAQVARQAGLPRQRIYDVLETLVQKGLAASRPGPHAKYAAIAPELAIERLLSARRRALSAMELDGAAIVEELMPPTGRARRYGPARVHRGLRDRGAINERFAEIQRSVKREILVFTKPRTRRRHRRTKRASRSPRRTRRAASTKRRSLTTRRRSRVSAGSWRPAKTPVL